MATGGRGKGAEPSGKSLVIGITADASGQYAASGDSDKRGVIMAIDEFNARGGALGRPIKWIHLDTETTPATGSRVAERMINQEKVGFLIGAMSSGVANAISQAYLTEQSDARAERTALRHLLSTLRGRPDLRWHLARYREHERDVADPGDLARLADREVFAPLDQRAKLDAATIGRAPPDRPQHVSDFVTRDTVHRALHQWPGIQAEERTVSGYLGRADLSVMVEILIGNLGEGFAGALWLLRLVGMARQFVGTFLPSHRKRDIGQRPKALRTNRSAISEAKHPSRPARAPHNEVERAAVAMPANLL